MSITPENIGSLYPTKMPSLEDLSDIQRALRIYHYGAIPGTNVGEYDPLNTNTANLKNPSMAYTLNDLQTQIDGIESGVLQNSVFAAKGDLISASANDTPVILSAGTNNQVLTVNSATASGLSWANTLSGITLSAPTINNPTFTGDVPQLSKNFIINGDLAINERGATTDTLTTSAKFAADRFFARRTSGSSGAQYQYLTSTSLDAFPKAVRIQRVTGNTATDTLITGQTIESANSIPLQGKAVVFSFWARKGANFSAASNALQVRVYTGTGTDQTGLGTGYTGTATPISGTATLTTSWQRFTFTGTIASTATQIQTVTQYVPVGTAGAADYFDVTGFQLEVGSVATPFSLAGGGTRGAELNLCRRYFEGWSSSNFSTMRFGNGYATSSTTANLTVQFKVRKRTGPSTVSWGFIAALNSANNTTFVIDDLGFSAGNESATMFVTSYSASFTTGSFIELLANITPNAYIQWNSEIS